MGQQADGQVSTQKTMWNMKHLANQKHKKASRILFGRVCHAKWKETEHVCSSIEYWSYRKQLNMWLKLWQFLVELVPEPKGKSELEKQQLKPLQNLTFGHIELEGIRTRQTFVHPWLPCSASSSWAPLQSHTGQWGDQEWEPKVRPVMLYIYIHIYIYM